MADKYDVMTTAIQNAGTWLPIMATTIGSAVTWWYAKGGKKYAKQAAAETIVGNAKVDEVHAAVQTITDQVATPAADTCETFARLVAENASLRQELERLKNPPPESP